MILGQTQESNLVKKDGWVGSSVSAYKFVYPIVSAAILAGEDVEVTYVDYDGLIENKEDTSDIDEKLSEISGELKVISAKLEGKYIK